MLEILDLNPMRVATGLANGVVDISITGGLITGLASNQGVYDLQIIDTSTQTSKKVVVEGYININPSIRF